LILAHPGKAFRACERGGRFFAQRVRFCFSRWTCS
jgi:hypothetical protein